jgi:serpin B
MVRAGVVLVLAPAVLLAACGGHPVTEPPGVQVLGADVRPANAQVPTDEVRTLARAQRALALDVYAALARQDDGDLVLGPTSLHTALLMVRAGAAGGTAAEMDAVLRLDGLDDPHTAAASLDRQLAGRGEADGVDLSSANRVWADRTFTPRPQYVEQLATAYGAALATLDLQGDPEGARHAINAWVAEQTRDRIPELFPTGTPTSDSRLVLANAVALDADWQVPFDDDRTDDGPFRLHDGSTVQVPTMHGGKGAELAQGNGWTAVRLPYAGGELAMTVVLPDDLASFERRLTPELLDDVESAMAPRAVELSLPRFTARRAAGLAQVLSALGMPSAFDGARADLSGIHEHERLRVAAVQHEAVVTVDETGTEAAAATGVTVEAVSLPVRVPVVVVVDRPFLFTVRDGSTGAVLFLGRVTDPR